MKKDDESFKNFKIYTAKLERFLSDEIQKYADRYDIKNIKIKVDKQIIPAQFPAEYAPPTIKFKVNLLLDV